MPVLADLTADGDGGVNEAPGHGWFAEAKTRPRDLFLRKSPLAPGLSTCWCQCAHSHPQVTKLLKLSRYPHKKLSVEDLRWTFSPLDSLIVSDSSRGDARRLLRLQLGAAKSNFSSSRYHRTSLEGTGGLGVPISSCSTVLSDVSYTSGNFTWPTHDPANGDIIRRRMHHLSCLAL